jgi:hypothetical protein
MISSWVLVPIQCGGLSDGVSDCQERVFEHGLTEDECHMLALRLSAHHARPTIECVREDHDTIDEDDVGTDRSPVSKGKAADI